MNNLDKRILEITKVYDNNGETYDRYTVFTPDGAVYGMSEGGEGFNQYIGDYTEVEMGEHLGTKLDSVPESIKNAVLNRMVDSQFVDLFQYYELMPENVSSIFNMYYEMGGNEWDYDNLKKLEGDLEQLGYTFDYGLDAEPYGLRPIELSLNQLKDFEEYKRGGSVYNKGRSWHLDRQKHNKSESWEKPMSKRKQKYDDGGGVGKMYLISYMDENGYEVKKKVSRDELKLLTPIVNYTIIKEYSKGGGINSGRDNLFKSQEPHEQRYKRKREWKEYKKEGWFGDWYKDGGEIENKINALYTKSNFINDDFNWKLKLLEMLQDQSIEAYNIYQKLSKEQKEDVLQEQFEVDNDMGSDGDGDIETSRENINILLEDAKNGKKYAKGGGVERPFTKDKVFKKDNISVQRVGGSDMWEVAINGKPMGRVLGAQTFEYAIKKAEKEFKNKYANGGGVGNFSEYSNDALTDAIINLSRFENTEGDIQTLKEELKKRKESIKLDSIEEMVKSNLFNGEISCEKLTEIIGCKPNYPYQIVGAIKLEKCYLRPYYKLV